MNRIIVKCTFVERYYHYSSYHYLYQRFKMVFQKHHERMKLEHSNKDLQLRIAGGEVTLPQISEMVELFKRCPCNCCSSVVPCGSVTSPTSS